MRALKDEIIMKGSRMKTRVVLSGLMAFILVVAFGRLAEADAPTGRYTTSAGTVYDSKTKLTWQQTSPSTAHALALGDAAAYCAGLSSTLGGSGWRLPTLKELLTIVDYSQLTNGMVMPPQLATDPVFLYPSAPLPFFWSSTASAQNPATAGWAVNFAAGTQQASPTSTQYSIRCVR